ncbi:DUF7680 family protein [Halorubrum sodomense]|uniref:DUF7680 domain-containing protein n=1 Tax=Halorubrum sodomense TaxID=35743 RepID=A0A1I6HPC5_HALSD|nr:hypothetical protein [Halorubrum sodomense]SFR56312.1 hypothetical protein SAMN04487937_2791 [Halorubrum sodomense]
MSKGQGFIEGESFAFTSGVYGDRPTFILTRNRVDDRAEITLYELAPKEIATARQERFDQVHKSTQVTTVELGEAIVGGETPADLNGDKLGHDWANWCAIKIATLRGKRFNEVSYLIQSTLREAGLEPETVCTGAPASLSLPEAAGVRLSIAFRAMKHVQRRDRLRAIADGISQMSLGECYYWHAKARSPTSPNGVKALRTLLADNIE